MSVATQVEVNALVVYVAISVSLLLSFLLIRWRKAFELRSVFLYGALCLSGFARYQYNENAFESIPQTVTIDDFRVLDKLDPSSKFSKYAIIQKGVKGVLFVPKSINDLDIGRYYGSTIQASKLEFDALPKRFDYSQYLKSKRLWFTAFAKVSDSIYVSNTVHQGFAAVANIRESVRRKINELLGDYDVSGLYSAILLGDKSLLSDKTQDDFSALGISHFLAVSGLHIGIIYLILSLVLGLQKYKRHKYLVIKISMVLLGIWFYALLSGFSVSVTRAAFMFSCFLIAKAMAREGNSFNILCFCAAVNICLNPDVVFDVGFQLSYAAVASIVVLYPKVQALLVFKYKGLNLMWDAICVSCCAQLGTLPIVIYTFGFFPVWFLISNLWLSLFSFVLTAGAFLFLLIAFIPFISVWYSVLVSWLFDGFMFGVQKLSGLPLAKASLFLDQNQMLVLLLMIFFWSIYVHTKRKRNMIVVLAIAIIFCAMPIANVANHHTLRTIESGGNTYYSYYTPTKKWLFPKRYYGGFDSSFRKLNADESLFQDKFRLPLNIRRAKSNEIVVLHIVHNSNYSIEIVLE